MYVNPLRHKGIIGSRIEKLKQFPYLARISAGLRWSVSPECLAFVQVRVGVLVSRRARVGSSNEPLKGSSIG